MDEQVDRHFAETAPLTRSREKVSTPTRGRRRLRWVWWLAALAVLAIVAFVAWRELGPAGKQAAAPAQSGRGGQNAPQPVGTATAATGDVRVIINALGTVTPLATVTVKTQIAGQLMQIGFTEGQIVHKGDFLAQIDPRPYQAALEQYEGQLARDQAALKQAQVDLARYQTLLKQDSIARQQAEDQIYVVQQDEGAIRIDQAQIDTQKLNLVYCHITAPVDGRVGLRQVDAGNYVQTSDPNGIVVITLLQPISVIAPIAEDYVPQVVAQTHAGAKLAVAAYDRANVTHLADGELETLDNQIDTTTGTVKLRAIFANPDDALFPNQFVNARLLVQTLHNVVTVPTAAVQTGAPGTYVFLVNANSKVSVRPVKVGVTDGDKVQIVSGLAAGDKVVVDGADRLHDGSAVTAKPESTMTPAQAQSAAGTTSLGGPATTSYAPGTTIAPATGPGTTTATPASGTAPPATAQPAADAAAPPAADAAGTQQPGHHHHRQNQQNGASQGQ